MSGVSAWSFLSAAPEDWAGWLAVSRLVFAEEEAPLLLAASSPLSAAAAAAPSRSPVSGSTAHQIREDMTVKNGRNGRNGRHVSKRETLV